MWEETGTAIFRGKAVFEIKCKIKCLLLLLIERSMWEKIEQRKTDFLDFGLTRLDTHDLLSAKVIEGKIYRKRLPKKVKG